MTPNSVPYRERDAQHQLRISYSRRNAGPIPGNDQDGIDDLAFPSQLRQFLNAAYPKLTTDLGWRPWKNTLERQVVIRDLGPSVFGLAGLVGMDNGHIAISPRAFDPRPELIALRREGTVAHELVHLLQFQSPLFMHCYQPASFSMWDPNWWLHESTALAAETKLVPKYPTAFCRLWDWAVKPQQSLDMDETGHLALPFILYLMDNVSLCFPASLYESTEKDFPSMLAVEILAGHLKKLGNDLSTTFLNYCVSVAPGLPNRPSWLEQLDTIVGQRSYRERFRDYPVSDINDVPVHHLGCRYFRFKPDPSCRHRTLDLELVCGAKIGVLKAKLSVVSSDCTSVEHHMMREQSNGLVLELSDFDPENVKFAVLTVANCAYGSGWAQYDNLRFSLRARLAC